MPTVLVLKYVGVFIQVRLGSFNIVREQTEKTCAFCLNSVFTILQMDLTWGYSETCMEEREIGLYADGSI